MSITRALRFNGRDSLVDLGKLAVHQVARDLTLEAWIFTETQQGKWTGIVSRIYDSGPVESGYGLILSGDNGLMFGFKTPGAEMQYPRTPPGSLKLGQWQHVAATYDGKQAVLYINGEKLATHPFVASSLHYEPDHNLTIGIYQDNDERYPFLGLIAEVRIWNTARTQEELQRTMKQRLTGTEPGLVGYWPLEEGGVTPDKSDKKSQGLIQGGYWEPNPVPLSAVSSAPAKAPSPAPSKASWTALQGSCLDLSVAAHVDGRLIAVVRGTNGMPYQRSQVTVGSDKFHDFQALDGGFKSRLVFAQHADGRLVLAGVGGNDALFLRHQLALSTATWTPTYTCRDGSITNLASATNVDGRIVLFATGKDDQIWQIFQTEVNADKWSPWNAIGGAAGGVPAVIRTDKGRLELFLRGKDGELWHTWQDTPNSPYYRPWHPLGGAIVGTPAIARHADGRCQIFARSPDDSLMTLVQQKPSGPWSKWERFGKGEPGAALDPVAITGHDQRIQLFVRGKDNAIWHCAQLGHNVAQWSPFASLGGEHRQHTVARNVDGRLSLFAIGTDNGLWHAMQRSPAGAF